MSSKESLVTIELSALERVQGGDFVGWFDRTYEAGKKLVKKVAKRWPWVTAATTGYELIKGMPGRPFTAGRDPGSPTPPDDSSMIGAP